MRHSLSKYDGLKGPKTKSGIRDQAVHPILRDALMPIGEMAGWPRTGYVFHPHGAPFIPGISGRAISPVPCGGPAPWTIRVAQGFRFHSLRHFYQSVVNASGVVSLVDQAKLMGHAKETMTIHNTHSLDGAGSARAAAEAVAIALRPEMRQICDKRPQDAEIIEDQN